MIPFLQSLGKRSPLRTPLIVSINQSSLRVFSTEFPCLWWYFIFSWCLLSLLFIDLFFYFNFFQFFYCHPAALLLFSSPPIVFSSLPFSVFLTKVFSPFFSFDWFSCLCFLFSAIVYITPIPPSPFLHFVFFLFPSPSLLFLYLYAVLWISFLFSYNLLYLFFLSSTLYKPSLFFFFLTTFSWHLFIFNVRWAGYKPLVLTIHATLKRGYSKAQGGDDIWINRWKLFNGAGDNFVLFHF